MPLQRVTLRLTKLRCITQSEGTGGSEPYLWVTYFAFGAQPSPFQMATLTPAYDAFRTEFPDGVRAGSVVSVPPFLASAGFDMDLDEDNTLVGCVAVLMEQDETPHGSIILGRIAYSKEIDGQLNDLVTKRILAGDFGPPTDQEINAIRASVKGKVEEAVKSNQPIWNFFTNQDDNIGFAYRAFSGTAISAQDFDFPEIVGEGTSNRFVLSGGLSVEAIPDETIDLCARERAAVRAKEDEIKWLQARRGLLQTQLQQAPPQQKAAIVAEIGETNDAITQAEAALPALQTALDLCVERRGRHGEARDGEVIFDTG